MKKFDLSLPVSLKSFAELLGKGDHELRFEWESSNEGNIPYSVEVEFFSLTPDNDAKNK